MGAPERMHAHMVRYCNEMHPAYNQYIYIAYVAYVDDVHPHNTGAL